MKSKWLIIGVSALAFVLVLAFFIFMLVPWSGSDRPQVPVETDGLEEELTALAQQFSDETGQLYRAFLDSIQYSVTDINQSAMTAAVDVYIPADQEAFSAVLDLVVDGSSEKTVGELKQLAGSELTALLQSRQFKTEKVSVIFPIEKKDGACRLLPCAEWEALLTERLEELQTLCNDALIGDVIVIEAPEAAETAEPARAKGTPLSQDELFYIIDGYADQVMERVYYIDMDYDGAKELIGIAGGGEESYQIWYCSSDGKDCSLAYLTKSGMESCEIELLALDNELHIAVNTCMTMGTMGYSSILALRGNGLSCLADNMTGYVYMNEEGDILLEVQDYDGMYDAGMDMMIGHTWKNTYLFFDGSKYKEYGASTLSEKEFLSYENARELKAQVKENVKTSDSESFEFHYYERKNGIVHIQCNVTDTNGNIEYRYCTVRLSGNELSMEPVEYAWGQIAPRFSNLEVVY